MLGLCRPLFASSSTSRLIFFDRTWFLSLLQSTRIRYLKSMYVFKQDWKASLSDFKARASNLELFNSFQIWYISEVGKFHAIIWITNILTIRIGKSGEILQKRPFEHKDMIEEWTLKKTEITWKRSWCSRFKKAYWDEDRKDLLS